MNMPDTGSHKLRYLVELAVLLGLVFTLPRMVEALAELMGAALPAMPLLRRTYIAFGFILAVLVYLRLRGETLASFGLVAPKRPFVLLGRGVLLFVVLLLFSSIVRPLIDPVVAHMTGTGTKLAEQYFSSVRGNLGMTLYLIPFGWLFGGFGEEVFYRGVVMTRIAQVFGEGRAAWIAAVLLQALPFAIGHSYQGPVGIVATYIVAVITGAATVFWGRNLWPAIIAHGLLDTFGFVALYAGLARG
jgi:membrane protease YdiL (CAAX protease family)